MGRTERDVPQPVETDVTCVSGRDLAAPIERPLAQLRLSRGSL